MMPVKPVTSSSLRLHLRHGWLLLALLLTTSLLSSAQTSTQELRTAASVRRLTVDEARKQVPVHLRGVVTFFEEDLYSRFIQDESAGIYLVYSTNIPALRPGQLVEVQGYSSPGEYAPVVVPEQVRIVGQAPLPPAKPVTYEQLASGTEDSQFVEIVGMVRSVELDESSQHYRIEIATGGGRLSVYVNQLPVKDTAALPDSTMRLRGVCSTLFNHQRQLFAIRLMVPRPEDLMIEQPAPADPFSIPSRPIGSLLQFAPLETYGHRVKVTGTVIHYEPGRALFLQHGDQGLEVQTRERKPLHLGDSVEALGFASQGDYTPRLQDAIFRKVATGEVPTPAQVTPDEALKGKHDCRLISVEGKLLDRALHGAERYLILQEGDFIFQAYLKENTVLDVFGNLKNGSRIGVTGVCRLEPGEWWAGEQWRAKSFSVQLRTADDVVLLRPPPWWTLRRVLWIAGVLGCVAMAAFIWVVVLRRQVTENLRELEVQIQERQRAERQREIEEERARVAHDLHDDLGAGLTEVNMLSTLIKSPTTSTDEKGRYLSDLTDTAGRMVTSLDEIVWAVNPRNDTIASLASYFASYAQRLLDLASVSCGLDVAEDLPDHPLDPKFRQQLFLAFKEALTNVVRHAGATQVWLRMSVKDGQIIVVLSDNGRGFASRERQAGADGVANMKERLRALGGQCEISSGNGNGTAVQFQAPLPKRLT